MSWRRSSRTRAVAVIALALCCLTLPAAGLAARGRPDRDAPGSVRHAEGAPRTRASSLRIDAARLLAPRRAARSRRSSSHFVVIMLENRELREVIGSGTAPYIEGLARREALATNYHAITHPSLPNYIALLAGDPLGISSDCTECEAHGVNLVDQLEAAHIGWRAYMQGMPHACYQGAAETSSYAKRHDPFMYFPQIASDPARCHRIVPFGRLTAALHRGTLPPFAWITPDLCADGHNCGNSAPDRFLSHLVPSLLAHLGPEGVLAIVWDEGATNNGCCSRAAGGTVPLILAGRGVRHGYDMRSPADHYSLLAAIEQAFGLRRLRGAACACTPSLDPMFKAGHPPHL